MAAPPAPAGPSRLISDAGNVERLPGKAVRDGGCARHRGRGRR